MAANKQATSAEAVEQSAAADAAADEMVTIEMRTGLEGVQIARTLTVGDQDVTWEHNGSRDQHPRQTVKRADWEAVKGTVAEVGTGTTHDIRDLMKRIRFVEVRHGQ